MPLMITELPLDAPLKKQAVITKEDIRKKAKVIVKEYDEEHFIVGIKRGVLFVKKLLVEKKDGETILKPKDVEKEITTSILAGTYDKEIIEAYDLLKPGKKVRRGRPKKAVVKETTGKRGRPKGSAKKKSVAKKQVVGRRGRPKKIVAKKTSGRRGRPKGSKNKPKE